MRIRVLIDNGDVEGSEGGDVILIDIFVVQDEDGVLEL